MYQWVVDTWVLAKCTDSTCEEYLDCIDFLSYVRRNGKLCLDHEKEVVMEYSRYIRQEKWLQRWWGKMVGEQGHLCYLSNRLFNRHKNKLTNKLNFHNDDIKFVGLSSNSRDKLLVSGDSDYNHIICQYLAEKIGIMVMHPTDALNY